MSGILDRPGFLIAAHLLLWQPLARLVP